MSDELRVSRRTGLKTLGAVGAAAFLGDAGVLAAGEPPKQSSDLRRTIFEKVWNTTLIDTHEHLCEEVDRLHPQGLDDWTLVLAGYLGSDLQVAGMPRNDYERFYGVGLSPKEKWKLVEPYWPAVKNTGYGLAARLSLRELYGVEELSAATVAQAQAGYEKLRRPGLHHHVLRELGKIESCQVNWLNTPFRESQMPTLMMQDLSIVGMFAAGEMNRFDKAPGIPINDLADWHKVIDWWFAKYARYAVAVKSHNAYEREIDYHDVPAEQVAASFKKQRAKESLSAEEYKALEDHLFWYAVRKATANNLPIKLHTGYYAGENWMPLSRLQRNAGSACDLCRMDPQSRFVFMHICYPYYEELLAVAKHYSNAYIDMCWSWIINPVAAKDFLKKYLVTAPANKIVTFGGDYCFVEQVLGHSLLVRQGIALALSELVEEGWLNLADAMELVDPIMHGNARRIFQLDQKEKILSRAPWVK